MWLARKPSKQKVPEPTGNSSHATSLSRNQDRCESRSRPAGSAIVTCLWKEGHWPGLQYPRIPGHEIAGRIDEVGSAVTAWKKGQRVGVGWHGGHCDRCESCRRGDFLLCRSAKICGFSYDGGWAEYVVVPAEAVASLPDELPADETAPLLCAGITTFNSLKNSGARAGDLVAVQGIGGLGHLGIQYASRLGLRTVAVGRGKDKEPLARQLGAVHYIDAAAVNAAEELQRLGGARVIRQRPRTAKPSHRWWTDSGSMGSCSSWLRRRNRLW